MKLRLILNLSIVTALGLLLAFSLLYGQHYRDNLSKELNVKLQERQQALHHFYNTQTMVTGIYARSPEVLAFTHRLLHAPALSKSNSALIEETRRFFLPALTGQGLHGFFIIAPNGRNLTSARDINIGWQNPVAIKQPTLFRYALNGNAVLSAPLESDVPLLDSSGRYREKRPTMFVLAPIQDGNDTIALLAFRIDPLDTLQNTLNQFDLGYHAECFLVSEEGVFLSVRHYSAENKPMTSLQQEYAVLNMGSRTPDGQATPAGKSIALHGMGNNVQGYTDYRGIRVIGAWRWDKKFRAGIVIEADYADAYRPLHVIYTAGFFAGLLLCIIWFSLSYLLKKNIRLQNLPSTKKQQYEILQHLPCGIILFNKQGMLEFINHHACQVLGYAESDTYQRDLFTLLTEQDGQEKHHTLSLGIKNFITQRQITDTFYDKNNQPISVEYNISILQNNLPENGILVFNTITTNPPAENSTTPANYIQGLKNMAAAIGQVINQSVAYVQILRHENNPHERDIIATELNNSAKLMHKTLDYYIDHALLQQGLLHSERGSCYIFPLLRNLLDEFELKLRNKKTEFYINAAHNLPLNIECDQHHLQLLLDHLLCHCLRSPGEGAIEMNIYHEQNLLHITLQSSAPGLPSKLLHKSMDENISEHLREQGDLWFCHALCNTLQGHLQIESDPMIGTSIWLNIPMHCSQPKTLRDLLPAAIRGKPIQLIIKNPLLHTWTHNTLQAMGLQTLSADAAQQTVDLIISDDSAAISNAATQCLYLGEKHPHFPSLALPCTPLGLCNALLHWHTNLQKSDKAITIAHKRILLVEDNEINQEVAKGLLDIIGVQCDIAENGALALEKLQREKFDLVLMDIQMPVMDGLTATRKIREQPEFQDLPIIALSAQNSAQDVAASLQAGMNEHLCKPISLQSLQTSLEKWLAQD